MRRRLVLAIAVCLGLWFCLPSHAVLAFSDTKGHWARMQIDHLNAREIINGYPDGKFRPDSYITRSEFVTMLIKVVNRGEEAEKLKGASSSFRDVPPGYWAGGYIELARELGYASGDGERFYPTRYITRQEAAAMLANCLWGMGAARESGETAFADRDEIAAWARNAVAWGANYGLIAGYPDGTFRPERNLTRAEVASLMEEFLDITGQKHHFYGKLVGHNVYLKQVRLETAWGDEVFALDDRVRIYSAGSREPEPDIKVLPLAGYFDLNRQGKIAFIYIAEKEEGARIELNLAALNGQKARSEGEDVLVRLEGEDELPEGKEKAYPGRSLELTWQAMAGEAFYRETKANGRGQLIAVIDSGIDAGHPDFLKTEDGFAKIVDFIDLTEEGKVYFRNWGPAREGFLHIDGNKVDVRAIANKDADYMWGYLQAGQLPSSIRADLPADRFLVVATASRYPGYYDTVYIDTNGDGQINDEKALKKYSLEHQVATIVDRQGRRFNLVAAEIPENKGYMVWGFDSLGHGTAVAGAAAASGVVKGIAPGAQLIAIKVMDGMGMAYLSHLEEALKRAAQAGSRIAVVSMGQYSLTREQKDYIRRIAGQMYYQYGMIMCLAAGNQGPGLGTVAQTSAVGGVISVGAYATPEMLAHDYGLAVDEPIIWYFSSAGPGSDGMASPLVVAPGSACTTYPLWSGSPYKLVEGTSIAAPHVAGGAALLMQAMSGKLHRHDPALVYHSLLAGAVKLPGYQAAEQGFGAVNLYNSWRELKLHSKRPEGYVLTQSSAAGEKGYGFYSRELVPGKLKVDIKSYVGETKSLAVGALGDFMKPEQYGVTIAPRGERSLLVNYSIPDEPGLYSDFIVADDYDTVGWDAFILQTVAVPYDLALREDKSLKLAGNLKAGKFKRYFIKVPAGMEKLHLRLLCAESGRVRMHVVSPDSKQAVSTYAGVGEANTASEVQLIFPNPAAGTWEVVVYSSATLSLYGLKESLYTLEASLDGEVKPESGKPYQYLVTACRSLKAERAGTPLTLFFWHYNTKLPGEGMALLENRLYEIIGGRVVR